MGRRARPRWIIFVRTPPPADLRDGNRYLDCHGHLGRVCSALPFAQPEDAERLRSAMAEQEPRFGWTVVRHPQDPADPPAPKRSRTKRR